MLFEGVKTFDPVPAVGGQPRVHLGQRSGMQRVEPAPAIGTHVDEPGLAEYPQVLRDAGLRDAQVVHQLADRPLTLAQ